MPRSDELRKARELVYTYSTTGKLTLVMRKSLNVMLQRALEQGIDQDWYSIPITRLVKNIEFGSHDHKYLEETLERMQTTLIRWQSTSADATKIVKDTVQLVGRTRIVGERGPAGNYLQKELQYKFDEDIKKRLLSPSVYALIDMGVMSKFKSAQSLALYEQIMEVKVNRLPEPDGWAYSDKLPWRQWRNLLLGEVTNDGDAPYNDAIKYFNRDVVRKALTELRVVAPDLEIEAIPFREGRRISLIQFRVRERAQSQQMLPLDEDSTPPIDVDGLTVELIALGLTDRDVGQIICRYELAHIEATIALTKARAARKDLEPLASNVAYFRKMLARPPEPTAVRNESPATTANRQVTKAKKRIVKEGPSPMEGVFAAMPDSEQRRYLLHWRNTEAPKYAASEYDKKGLETVLVRKSFFSWLEKHLSAP